MASGCHLGKAAQLENVSIPLDTEKLHWMRRTEIQSWGEVLGGSRKKNLEVQEGTGGILPIRDPVLVDGGQKAAST